MLALFEEASQAFELRSPPVQTVPFIFNSPHSGRSYPPDFIAASRLDAAAIRRSEDLFVDELFAGVTAMGAPILMAHFPRAYLDVNREPYELDPRMFRDALPGFANIASLRVAGGLGTIPRIVADNMEIYRDRLDVSEALERIDRLYRPYHACLRKLMAATHVRFGHAVLIDCHSMPDNVRVGSSGMRPDFIIGDRYGTSASGDLTALACSILSGMGYHVLRNKPYAGGFITEHYGRPGKGLHALQIEINRGLYAEEQAYAKNRHFDSVVADIEHFVAMMIDVVMQQYEDRALAAE